MVELGQDMRQDTQVHPQELTGRDSEGDACTPVCTQELTGRDARGDAGTQLSGKQVHMAKSSQEGTPRGTQVTR